MMTTSAHSRLRAHVDWVCRYESTPDLKFQIDCYPSGRAQRQSNQGAQAAVLCDGVPLPLRLSWDNLWFDLWSNAKQMLQGFSPVLEQSPSQTALGHHTVLSQ